MEANVWLSSPFAKGFHSCCRIFRALKPTDPREYIHPDKILTRYRAMPDTRASVVAGKRVRALSGSPPRVPDGEDPITMRDLQRELSAQREQYLAAVSDMKAEHQHQLEQQEARHRADVQRMLERLERVENEMAQLRAAAESRDRASRAPISLSKAFRKSPVASLLLRLCHSSFQSLPGTRLCQSWRPGAWGRAVRGL